MRQSQDGKTNSVREGPVFMPPGTYRSTADEQSAKSLDQVVVVTGKWLEG